MTAPAQPNADAPLYTASYELTPQLVDEAASALAGPRYHNPPTIASAIFLIGIVAYGLLPGARQNVVPLVVLFLCAVGCLQAGDRWQRFQLRGLRRAGLDTAFIDKGDRRMEVRVFADRVETSRRGADGTQTLPLSAMKKPVEGPELLVLKFSGPSYVIVPQRSMSLSRFKELVSFVSGQVENRK